MDPKVSVILPVHNVKDYLRDCLDSILNQTYHDWECLLVDDSVDESSSICDEYGEKDKRFKVLHVSGRKLGEARNYGLMKSVGEFVTFIDSDDWIGEGFLEFLVNHIKEDDMVMCHATFDYPDRVVDVLPIRPDYIRCTKDKVRDFTLCSLNIGYAYKHLNMRLGSFNCAWGKLYRRNFLIENNILFLDVSACEDMLFFLEVLRHIENFSIYNKSLYHYRIRSLSAVRGLRPTLISDTQRVLNYVEEYVSKYHAGETDFIFAFYALCLSNLFNVSNNLLYHKEFEGRKKRRQEQKKLKESHPTDLALSNLSKVECKKQEVRFCAYAYKYNLYLLLDLYFGMRPRLKDIYVEIRGK